jgi:hypothetical protein
MAIWRLFLTPPIHRLTFQCPVAERLLARCPLIQQVFRLATFRSVLPVTSLRPSQIMVAPQLRSRKRMSQAPLTPSAD